MWVFLSLLSALLLGIYDIFKKKSVAGNNVLSVLFLNTFFGALLLSPVIIIDFIGAREVQFDVTELSHVKIIIKSLIVLSAWIMGYYGIKHLPLTITGPISATRPVLVLIGALVIYSEQLNILQWTGVAIGFISLFMISRIGAKEGYSLKDNKWLWLCLGATVMGAVSGLYDKYLLRQFDPLQVQAWYSFYQCIIMGFTIFIIKRIQNEPTPFTWRWSIPCIAIFLTLADLAYFYALSYDDSMIAIVSMMRRGSVIVPFIYGVMVLKEKNVKLKALDLTILLIGLLLLVIGSTLK